MKNVCENSMSSHRSNEIAKTIRIESYTDRSELDKGGVGQPLLNAREEYM